MIKQPIKPGHWYCVRFAGHVTYSVICIDELHIKADDYMGHKLTDLEFCVMVDPPKEKSELNLNK